MAARRRITPCPLTWQRTQPPGSHPPSSLGNAVVAGEPRIRSSSGRGAGFGWEQRYLQVWGSQEISCLLVQWPAHSEH